MEIREYKPGEIIIQEGTPGEEIFIIKEGKVRIFKTINEEKVELAILGEGEILGEMSLLLNLPRSASVEAVEKTKTAVYNRFDFLDLIRGTPDFAYQMLKKFAARLQNANTIIGKLQGIKKSFEIMYGNISR